MNVLMSSWVDGLIICVWHLVWPPAWQVLVLSMGRVAYFGPQAGLLTHFSRLGHDCGQHVNVSEFVRELCVCVCVCVCMGVCVCMNLCGW